MKIDQIKADSFAMPVHRPAYPRPPFRFVSREYFIISYETDVDAVAAAVPEPLTVDCRTRPLRVHPHAGFHRLRQLYRERPGHPGDRSGRPPTPATRTPCISTMKARSPRGREIWGFPKKLATPVLRSMGTTRSWARSTTVRSVSRPARWATSIEALDRDAGSRRTSPIRPIIC